MVVARRGGHGLKGGQHGVFGCNLGSEGGIQGGEGGILGGEGGLEGLDSVAESLDIARGGGLGLGVPPVLEPVDTSTRARHAWGAVSA